MTERAQVVSPRELRKFGLVMAVMISLFFGVLIPWIWSTAVSPIVFVVSGVFAVVAAVAPILLKPVYFGWMKVGTIVGSINTRVLLALLFFLFFVPLGFLLRLSRDPMRRKLDRSLPTYLERSAQPVRNHLDRPY
ncbi:MAG TPA: SxtJ family membrane protein [Gammaproteobacteria bacterium]